MTTRAIDKTQPCASMAEVRARIAADGGDLLPSTPEEYFADIEREDKQWGALIRKLKLKVE